MKLTVLSGRDDLIAAVADHLRPQGKDYSRWWVVFSETRPGHYLRKALAERSGSPFFPPRVDSLEGFVDRLHREKLMRSEPLIDPLDAVALLFDIHRGDPQRLGRSGFLSADAFFPLGLKIYSDLEEVTLAGLGADDLSRVDGLLGNVLPPASAERLQSLGYFHRRFYELLSERRFSSPASRTRDAAEHLRPEHLDGIEEVCFAGIYVLRRLERRLVKMILEWGIGRLFLERAPGWERILETLEIPRPDADLSASNGPSLPDPLFLKSPDTHGQIFALNKCLEDVLSNPGRLGETRAVVLCPFIGKPWPGFPGRPTTFPWGIHWPGLPCSVFSTNSSRSFKAGTRADESMRPIISVSSSTPTPRTSFSPGPNGART